MNYKYMEIVLNDNHRLLHPIQLTTNPYLPICFINSKENKELKYYKDQIDYIPNKKDWDIHKKLTNDYELVHIPSHRRENNSISLYNPLSRSYFKMIEIMGDFNILYYLRNKNITTAHLAEGPGGFIEALVNKRKNQNDIYHAITLKSLKKEIPGWRKTKYLLEKNPNIKIHYGSDNTGNLYNLDNILNFRDKVGIHSCNIVTADGGFDFSVDFNKQEQLSSHLIFCEIITAISIQKLGGVFICKIFDSYCKITLDLIWLLSCVYNKVVFTKPHTSRPANSEKYIVAVGFRGINQLYLEELYDIIKEWEKIEIHNINNIEDKIYIHSLFNNNYDLYFLNKIKLYNQINCNTQIYNIKNTLDILYRKKIIDKKKIIHLQIIKAIEWCLKYNVKINKQSYYLKDKDYYHKKYNLS